MEDQGRQFELAQDIANERGLTVEEAVAQLERHVYVERKHRVRIYKWWMGAQDWYRWECSCGAHQRGGSRTSAHAERYGRMHAYNVRRPKAKAVTRR